MGSSNMISRSGLSLDQCNINVHTGRSVRANAVMNQGNAAALVNKEIRATAKSMVVSDGLRDVRLARLACRLVKKKHRCKYTKPIEKCKGKGRLNISLKALLAKDGVAGNRCLMSVRKRLY